MRKSFKNALAYSQDWKTFSTTLQMLLVERISSLVRLLKPVIVLRAWYYFRVGQSGYLSLIVGLIQFLYTIMPGKESRIGYPMMLLNLEVQKRFLKTLNMMDKDLEAEFDQMEELVKGLLSGKKLE